VGSPTQHRGATRPSRPSVPAALRGPVSWSWSAGDQHRPASLSACQRDPFSPSPPSRAARASLSATHRHGWAVRGETGSPQPRATCPGAPSSGRTRSHPPRPLRYGEALRHQHMWARAPNASTSCLTGRRQQNLSVRDKSRQTLSLGNAVLQVPLSGLEMHPAPSRACSASAFPEVYYGSGTFPQDRGETPRPSGRSRSAQGACPLPSQQASSLRGHPHPPSLGTHGKAALITAAARYPQRNPLPGSAADANEPPSW